MGLADQSLIREQAIETRLEAASHAEWSLQLEALAQRAQAALSSSSLVGAGRTDAAQGIDLHRRVHVRFRILAAETAAAGACGTTAPSAGRPRNPSVTGPPPRASRGG